MSHMYLGDGCGIQMSQATPTKFSVLFKHTYSKLFWKFGGQFFLCPWPYCATVLEAINRYGVKTAFYSLKVGSHCEGMFDVTKNLFHWLFTGIQKKNILSHPVTSRQPHKIVQILMRHTVWYSYLKNSWSYGMSSSKVTQICKLQFNDFEKVYFFTFYRQKLQSCHTTLFVCTTYLLPCRVYIEIFW